jgi:RHS repeat-associated protein
VKNEGTIANKYLFAGEQFDSSLGDYYLRDRFYDVGAGRFLRRDVYEGSLDDPLSLHKYTYAHSNPVIYTDPSGFITRAELLAAFKVADILFTLAYPDPLSVAMLVASPPGVPAGFAKGLNKVFGGIARGPMFARMAQGTARISDTLEDSALAARSFMASKGFKPPFISDEYLQGLKSFLPSRTVGKVVDFVSEGKNGLVLVEAKSQLTTAQLASSINPGGKMVGTSNALEAVYKRGGAAFPGIERQVITATDLSKIPTGATGKLSKVPTGAAGEFQVYQNGVPAMPNGVPVFLQQL